MVGNEFLDYAHNRSDLGIVDNARPARPPSCFAGDLHPAHRS